ncbi:MAG: hypothetical protein HDT18_02580 [Oscillibacter sp.]|nr:hypothetical protein [Oscillibacter sp.]
MNRKLKQALSDAFYAPSPVRKAAFLKQHRRRELDRWELIALQVRYIQWWVWLLSLVLTGFILVSVTWTEEPATWCIAALTPFLALLVITENGRAQLYQMEELELACRMSRQSVILARMVALGVFHLIQFGLLTPLLVAWGKVETIQAGVYLLTPYLLTAALGLELNRRIRNREGLLACGAAAAAISVLGALVENSRPALYQPENLIWWGMALAVAIVAVAIEFTLNIKKMGELQWT